ncbi:MAG: rimM [Friedmanniella sp.]|nr:rimM [Friedmanniella sp.]
MTKMVEVMVGIIGRAHGIRGEVAVEPRTDEPERRFAPGQTLRVEDSSATFTVRSSRDHSGRLLVVFEELADRTAAEKVRGTRLVVDVDADERPEEPEEFYDRQLVGLRALTEEGVLIGTITTVLHLPLQDMLEIGTPTGAKLVPFVEALVPVVDLAAGTVTVHDLEGLLTDEDDEDDDDEADGDEDGPETSADVNPSGDA